LIEEKSSLKWLEYIVLFSLMVLIVALSFMFFPASVYLALLIPLPVLIATYRHSVLLGAVIAALSSVFFVFLLMNAGVVILIVALSTVGIGIGAAMREKLDYKKILAVGIISALLTVMLVGIGLYLTMGQTPKEIFNETADRILTELSTRDIPVQTEQVEALIETVRMLYPSMIAVGAVALALVNFLAGSWALVRLKMTDVPALPPLTRWAFPMWLSVAFIVVWVLTWQIFAFLPQPILFVVANLANFLHWLMTIQGLCIVLSFLRTIRLPIWGIVLLVLPVWLFAPWFMALLGTLDPWLHFRGRIRLSQEERMRQLEKNKRDQN